MSDHDMPDHGLARGWVAPTPAPDRREGLDPSTAYERQRDQELWQKGYDAGLAEAMADPLVAPALDVERLARALADHHDICSRMAIPECAPDIAAEYAALAPATGEGAE